MAMGSFKWMSHKSMPTKRVYSTAVVYNECLFVVGGCDERGTPLDSFEMIDFAAREPKWKKLDPMPSKRAGVAVVALKGKIVAVGGVSEAQNPVDAVEIYDIETKKWSKEDPLSDALMGLSIVVRDEKVLIMGGMGKDTNPNSCFLELNLTTLKWNRLPEMITPRYATFSFLVGSDLYVVGGRQGKIPRDDLEVFHFETGKWEKLDPIPSKRVFPMYVCDNKNIYSLGGLNQPASQGFADACEIFDTEKKTWKVGTPIPTKRGDLAAAVLGGKIVCAGGLGNEGKPMKSVEVYDPVGNTWTEVSCMPTAHSSCAHIIYNDRLYVIGGLGERSVSASVESLGYTKDQKSKSKS